MRGFAAEGIAACFDEIGTPVEPTDIDDPANAPAKDPASHLDRIYWHSEFVVHELAIPAQVIEITHPAVNTQTLYYNMTVGFTGGSPTPTTGGPVMYGVQGARSVTDILLYEHNLGYKPSYIVALGNGTIGNGTLVQVSGGGYRSVSPYVTDTEIRMKVVAIAGSANLPATTLTYGVFLFREPEQDPSKALFGKDGGHLVLGRGRIDSQYKYLRRVAGAESSFDYNTGRTVDYANGGTRQVIGDVVQQFGAYQGTFGGSFYYPVDVSQ